MSAGLQEGSRAAPEFRKNECCFSCCEGAKHLRDGAMSVGGGGIQHQAFARL